MSDLITFSSSGLPDDVRVVGFRGREWISRPYRFEIFLVTKGEDGEGVDLGDALGAKAQLVLDRADDRLPPYVFAGILAGIELLHETDGQALLRATMVPRLWELSLARHSRVFTNMSIPEILQAVLEEHGISGDALELRLGSYEKEAHVCQYRETDLDFVSRWMEREGIYYFFAHEEGGEKLVLCDNMAYEDEPIGVPIRYYPQTGADGSARASFRSFRSAHVSLPASVKLTDYEYTKPGLDVSGKATISQQGSAEVVQYGDRFFTPAAGARLAKLRAEESKARQIVFQAAGTRTHLHVGKAFELEDHPRAKFNDRYLAIEVSHHANQAAGLSHFRKLIDLPYDEVYFVDVLAIPASVQFRAESRVPWPRIHGFENGVVDGAAESEYAQIDDMGRYNIKLHFDEGTNKDGKASTYVRMMQPHGGGIEGFHFPLRKGTEVIVSFLGGDPDRPVISGVVPNALTPSPVTSGNHTKNVIQTGGRNRWELEDKAGQQRITMSTPYANTYIRMGSPNNDHEMILKTDQRGLWHTCQSTDHIVGTWQNIEVGTYQTESIGTYYQMQVGGYKEESVTGYVKETYGSTKDENVTGKVTETWPEQETTVSGLRKQHVGTLDVDVDNDSTLDIGGNQTINVTGDRTLNVTGNRNDVVVGNVTVNVTQNYTQNVTSNMNVLVLASRTETVAGEDKSIFGGPEAKITMGPTLDYVLLNKNEGVIGLHTETNVGAKIEVFVGAKVALLAAANFEIGASITFDAVPFKCKAVQTKAEAIMNWVGCNAINILSGMKII
ncbi:type VI secretion system Vgr family protein [Polyangium mundeleinium]|uniref:Type VI secretion system tip protein TssI/VgrG n=1 Tax=Polyangium mundeleinium TaxID=2995306 RepID=A0ABT5EP27_9BACT|nr:type VI secretion system tip protein TssI/VgrG [Polyangium mundeleinium]MDC0742510.1 type VI secretion system tip protein TssI/VgrG [Polyangium mundeleinium]